MSKRKKQRRFLKRLANRKDISYSEAIKTSFGVEQLAEIDKNVLYSLHKKRNKGKTRKYPKPIEIKNPYDIQNVRLPTGTDPRRSNPTVATTVSEYDGLDATE